MANVKLHYSIVDAFTARAFTGNPAAIVMLDEYRSDAWMQQTAAEFNLSETAFVETLDNGSFRIRWFTPRVEVDLCGHATLAAAYVLWASERAMKEEPVRFDSPRSGRFEANLDGSWIELDFPADPPREAKCPVDPKSMIGIDPVEAARGRSDWVFELPSEDDVRRVEPNLAAIAKLDARGVIVTGKPTQMEGVDFVSRCFYPSVGIDEDPVTGSAHCTLAGYWSARLGRNALRGFQASRRGGIVRMQVTGDGVTLAGQAVLVAQGRIAV